jgi:hypothetical protein
MNADPRSAPHLLLAPAAIMPPTSRPSMPAKTTFLVDHKAGFIWCCSLD